MVGLRSKAMRTVLRWQTLATVMLTVLSGWLGGRHGAMSAALGGLVSISASIGFAGVAGLSRADDAAGVLFGALRAEAVKIILIVVLLWAVMVTYRNVVMLAFFGTFLVATVVYSAAALIHDSRTQA
jgi:ATP synthase protein I